MRKWRIFIEEKWDSAHMLELPYESKCNGLHGHCYRIRVEISAEVLTSTQMVIDFAAIKSALKKYDHTFLNDFFVPSTVENIASVLLDELQSIAAALNPHARVESVSVRESETTECLVAWGE